jgi:hypothetical protein
LYPCGEQHRDVSQLKLKLKIQKIYMIPKFNPNIKFKLNLGLFKYVDIKTYDSNKVSKFNVPS